MKKFETLTITQKRKIIFEQVNSMFEINKEELRTLINPELLSNRFDEFPPIMLGNISIGTALAFSGNDPADELQKMYLYAYHLGGRVKFGYLPTLEKYYIYFNFSFQPNAHFFNKQKSNLVINGEDGLRFCKLIQISNISSLTLVQMPSLTLKVIQDSTEIINQSLMTKVSAYQYNPEIVQLNQSFNQFKTLEIQIVDNSQNHDYNCVLSYE